jgi:glycosyltransferase involved in cell wall biosynthesis
MNPHDAMVSIVIPCYNDGKYLLEAVESARRQSYRSIEIIVSDDASTDEKTLALLHDLHENAKDVKVLFSEKNSGPAAARNRAIKEARGEYILPLDADDKIASTYVQKAIEIMRQSSDVGIVYCNAALFGEKNEPWHLPPYAFPEILTGNMIFATALFRKKDWEAVGGYDEALRSGNEDYEFWLSLIERGAEVYRLPEILFYYRIKSTSRTSALHADKSKELDTYEYIYRKHRDTYERNIRVFFETIDRQRRSLAQKDDEIRQLHFQLAQRDEKLAALHSDLQAFGEELAHARSVIDLRDRQLEEARLKNRFKRLMRRLNPFYKEKNPVCAEKTPQPRLSVYTYTSPVYTEAIRQEIESFASKPLISIVMPVYNVDPKWLEKAIMSVRAQWYDNWELCIVDDKSTNPETIAYLRTLEDPKIKIGFGSVNKNIAGASNDAAAMAKGEYIALLDNDDELTVDALYEVVKAINQENAEFIYSDEDFIDTDGRCANPHFKPDWSPDLLMSHNYITHLACFKRSLFEEVGGFDERFSGSQDYDLFLKLTEKTDRIVHIPKVLYHWRTIEGSTSADSKAKPEALAVGKRVLEEALRRRGIEGRVEYGNIDHYFRVRYAINATPKVSIIIPFKDKPELLEMCIGSILQKSSYENFEIIGISNNSQEEATFTMMHRLQERDERVAFYAYDIPFNYAAINNYAVRNYASGAHVLLLNNDIEVISEDWIEAMLEHSQRGEIGCVGAKLYYPDDTIQHAGIILGLGGYAGHSHKHYPRESHGYFNRLNAVQNVSAVTAACMMVKRSVYEEVGGMDEEQFAVAYNDVDFCLRVMQCGYRNLFTPYAEMYHHESVSRGYENSPDKITRFHMEKRALARRHAELLDKGDPYYNPNLTRDREDFGIASHLLAERKD